MTATAGLLGASWAALVLGALWPQRPLPRAARARVPNLPRRRPGRAGPDAQLGALVLRLLAGRGAWGARSAAGIDATRLGRALGVGVPVTLVHPALGISLAALVWALPSLRARRAERHRVGLVRRELPEAVDLLALAVGAGLTVPLALDAVARRSSGPVGAALASSLAAAAAGRRLADALAELPEHLGEQVRPLVAALVGSLRDGSPLTDGLDRLATELRADRRRRAEELARRVPVKLLFPLVTCILPAFALLTVAPLLAGALQALRP